MYNDYDVIIAGGSYAGLAAGMALGRALRNVLIIDNGKPCNRQTPYSHNFLTRDGSMPQEIAALGKQQVLKYDTVQFLDGRVTKGVKHKSGFEIQTDSNHTYKAKKLIFATGIKDVMPPVPGLSDCWGISVLHCPYCHGYEVRNQKTGILGNGEYGYDFCSLISNWTNDLTLYTNGKSTLTAQQTAKLQQHHVQIVEGEIDRLEHQNGSVHQIIFKNDNTASVTAVYTRVPFVQNTPVPETLGCQLNEDGYVVADPSQKTTVHGVFACGDNTTRLRTLANAVAMGTTAGMMVNKELIEEAF